MYLILLAFKNMLNSKVADYSSLGARGNCDLKLRKCYNGYTELYTFIWAVLEESDISNLL